MQNLTDTQLKKITRYLQTKYGLSLLFLDKSLQEEYGNGNLSNNFTFMGVIDAVCEKKISVTLNISLESALALLRYVEFLDMMSM